MTLAATSESTEPIMLIAMAQHQCGNLARRLIHWALIAIVAMCWTAESLGQEVASDGVRAAVEAWVRTSPNKQRPAASIRELEEYRAEDGTVAYVAHLAGGGFCLCGADNLVLPVYLYCGSGTYSDKDSSVQFVLREIVLRTQYMRSESKNPSGALTPYAGLLQRRAARWQQVLQGEAWTKDDYLATSAVPAALELPLETHWDQHSPYNGLCPLGVGGDRTLVGCVATATAQVLRYWKNPAAGFVGIGVFQWDGDDSCEGELSWGAVLSAYYADPYDWDNMPAMCYPWSPQEQRDAVAELCYEVGVALAMDYGVCASGAYMNMVPMTFEEEYGYDTDCSLAGFDIEQVTQELQYLRVVEIGGCSDIDGLGCHAWLVYGYDSTNDPDRELLMNMGWGYTTGDLADTWYTVDSVPMNLLHHQREMVTRIAPRGVVRFVANDGSGDGTPNDPYGSIQEAVAECPSGAVLILRAGAVYQVTEGSGLLVNRPVVLRGKNAIIGG